MRRFITLIPYRDGVDLAPVHGERVTKSVFIHYTEVKSRAQIIDISAPDAERRGLIRIANE